MKGWKLLFFAWLISAAGLGAADGSLVGTWRIVSAQTIKSNGERLNLYGEHPAGFLTYTPDGRMFAIITAEGRKRSQAKDRFEMPVSEQADAFSTMVAYSGTYTVEKGKVTHHVEVASFENWVHTDQVRLIRLEGLRLTLTSLNTVGGDQARTDLVWERLR